MSEVSAACDFVVEAARQAGLSEKALHHCRLAVDEACTNVIEHGYPSGGSTAVIDITVRKDDRDVIITICDDSPQFDPLTQPDPDLQGFLADLNPGGWGVFFIRKVMDRVKYSFESGRNCLTMTKHITDEARASLLKAEIIERDLGKKIMQLIPSGRLDLSGSVALEHRLAALLDAGLKNIVVDLSRTDYISSGALKMLVGMWQRARELKGDVVLAGAHEQARDVLAATGLDLVFVLVRTSDEAVSHFSGKTTR